MLKTQVYRLMWKDWLLDWRSRSSLSTILLYTLVNIFIVYSAFLRIEPFTWNVLLWLLILFAATNAIARNFLQESEERMFYYRQLCHPLTFLWAKWIYNISVLTLISGLTALGFSFFTGYMPPNPLETAGILLLGSVSIGLVFTFIAAIASKGKNASVLMSLLGFPVIIPQVLLLVQIHSQVLELVPANRLDSDLLLLCAVDLLVAGLSILLFPSLWND